MAFLPLLLVFLVLLSQLMSYASQPGLLEQRSNAAKRYYEHKVHLDENKHNDEFFSFVTRPDLNAPRWNIETFHDYDSIALGYWFSAPYSNVAQSTADAPWNAPHIYDGNGDLIWSGAALFDGFTTFDFRVSLVHGQPMLSVISPRHGKAFIFNDAYETYKIIDMGGEELRENTLSSNSHEFTTVGEGKKALYLTRLPKKTSKKNSEAIGYDGECYAIFDGIVELETDTWSTVHTWNSEGRIGLDESYVNQEPINERCTGDSGWDFFHANSIDTFANGDYLVSGRRTSTIYKISRSDGSIVWRLGGRKSDFKVPLEFGGQHAAKVYEQNDTHTFISFLDNAFLPPGNPQTTNFESRGLLLALDTTSMIAEVVTEFPHPEGKYAISRGNMHMLPNKNAWICWSDGSLQSEHTYDATLIMKARFKADISSYRTFKSPWVGRPRYPPDVHAAIVDKNGQWYTVVHVSWNGATEVRSWKVYHTSTNDTSRDLVATVARRGFETMMWTAGYGSYVIAEALDQNDEVLGTSNVFASLPPRNRSQPALTPSQRPEKEAWPHTVLRSSLSIFIFGIILGCLIGSMASRILGCSWLACRGIAWWKRKKNDYEPLAAQHEAEEVEMESYANVDDDEEPSPRKEPMR